jgi:outer membrane protein assembly factor BamD (BamD/ComL family)
MNTTNDNNLTAKEWYEQGNGFRQQGNWQQAINCYLEAIELDPCSPAVEAKEMLLSILNFYHKDAYNP